MGVVWLLSQIALLAGMPPPARGAIVAVYESGVDAYAESLAGVTGVLGEKNLRVVDLQAGKGGLAQALAAGGVQAVIAVGSGAAAEVQVRKPGVPVIAVLALHGGPPDGFSRVDTDIPIVAQLAGVHALWPKWTRVGIIRNPARSRYTAEALESAARREGLQAVVLDCDGPGHLMKVLTALKGKADYLLCLPDPDLYNPNTVRPLVMASLEDRLPLVGFSPAFVRAGAAAGIYPDYRDTGRQAAEMAQRMLRAGERPAEESPRKLQMAVNQRVARLLGLDFQTTGQPVEVFK